MKKTLALFFLLGSLESSIRGQDAPGQPTGRTKRPEISQFVLYAERSIRLGNRSRGERGDIGVRTALAPKEGSAQLLVGEHDKCRNLFAPSMTIENDAKALNVFTNLLKRDPDSKISAQSRFPAAEMPPLPLVFASGKGDNVILAHDEHRSLDPGTYGSVKLGHNSTLELRSGKFTFVSVKMDEDSKLLGDKRGVDVRIVDGLWMGKEAKIAPRDDDTKAVGFTIEVAGGDPESVSRDTRLGPTTVVSIGPKAHIHGLLAAPHGTVWMADEAGAKGAIAGFDIIAGEHVEVELESGFPLATASQHGSQQLHGYFAVQPDPRVAPLIGPVPQSALIALDIGLPIRNPRGLQTFINQVSDPNSPMYRQYLTLQQFTATYGATPSDYQGLIDWATSHGLTPYGKFANNLLLSVGGTAPEIEQALYVNLVYRQRADGTPFLAADRDPSLDVTAPILRISGLDDYVPSTHSNVNGTGGCPGPTCGQSYRATDIRNAYLGVGSNCQTLDGTGQVIGLLELESFNPADIAGYDAAQNLNSPPAPVVPLAPNNVSLVAIEAPPWFTPGPPNDNEATLDIEMAQAMAPGAKVFVWQGSTGITDHADAPLHAMATSIPPLSVASNSWNFGRSDNAQQAVSEMAAQGVSYFVASGDYGDIGDPQDDRDMDNQTLVGGTFLSTNSLLAPFPNPVYPNNYYPAPPTLGDATWNQNPAPRQKGVTGGGIMDGLNRNGSCDCFPYNLCCGSAVGLPGYQKSVNMAQNLGSTQFRNYPDVALLASNIEIFYKGNLFPWGGTSAAAPLWAGFMALVDQRGQQNGVGLVGFANPVIYDIGLTSGSTNDIYAASFNDVADGVSNFDGFGFSGGFKSVPGYDLATGWGTPKCQLINQLSTVAPLTPQTVFDELELLITTGGDDLRSDSGATADLFLVGASTPFTTIKLKDQGAPKWDNGTMQRIPVSLSSLNLTLTPSTAATNGIGKVRINFIESNPNCDTFCDNWDVTGLQVRLFNPGPSPEFCQLDLTPNSILQDGRPGLVRFSNTPGSSGSGRTAEWNASGCASTGSPLPPSPAQIQFIISTGDDDLRGDSDGLAALYAPNQSTPFQTIRLKNSGDPAWDNWTLHNQVFPLIPNAPPIDHIVLILGEHGTFNDYWNINGINVMRWDANGGETCLINLQGNPLVRFGGDPPDNNYTLKPRSGCP